MTRSSRALVGALTALLLLAPALDAQAPGRSQADRERLEQRVRARMAEMIRERLDLSAQEGARLGEVMEGFHRQRRALRMEERELRRQVGRWAGGEEDPPGEARVLLDRMVQLREAEARLFRAEQEALLEVLTPEQLVTFHALRDRMAQRLGELRRGPGGGGPRDPGGPPGGF